MTFAAAGVCAALVLLGAEPGEADKGDAAPPAFAAAGHRVHIVASEDLNADSLGALARPGVVLWLTTRSNALRPMTVDRLRRFAEAWVELRPPILPGQAMALAKAPTAGVWLRGDGANVGAVERLGIRRVAVEVRGAFDDAALLRSSDAARVTWAPAEVDLEGFARLGQVRGAPALVVPLNARLPSCDAARAANGRVVFRVASLRDAVTLARCGAAVRALVEPTVSDLELAELFGAAPSAELEVTVDADDRRAMRTRQLLQRLEAASRPK